MIRRLAKNFVIWLFTGSRLCVWLGAIAWFFVQPRLRASFLVFAIVAATVTLIPIILPKRAKRRKSVKGALVLLRSKVIKWRGYVLGLALGILFGAWLLVPIAATLALVAALLLLTIILMLIPIRYRVHAVHGGEGGTNATAKASYLFGLIGYVVRYEAGTLRRGLRIAWHTFYGKEKPAEEIEKLADDFDMNEKAAAVLKRFNIDPPPQIDDSPASVEVDNGHPQKPEPPRTIREKFADIKAKLADINSMKDAVLTYPHRKFIMDQAWRTFKKIMNIILPKKLDISGIVGFEDPSKTGFFFAAYGVILSIFDLGNKVRISCLFDTPDTVIKLNAHAKGSFSIARITVPVIRLILRRQVRTLIKDLLNLRKG